MTNTKPCLMAYAKDNPYQEKMKLLSNHLGIPMTLEKPSENDSRLFLCLGVDGLSLSKGKLRLHCDLTHMLPRLKTNNLNGELLVRAAKIKKSDLTDSFPTAIDATAGLGEDSLLLAAAGYRVQLYEYNPVIAALLKDALARAKDIPELSSIVRRMQVFEGDSITMLSHLKESPDLILLDPMFPARQKSGLVKKKFQLLQQLEQPCTREEDLLQAALNVRPGKIIIKRPAKGPYLAGKKPSYSIQGKGIRYDCILP
ncbi:MAG: class I SAM-dependent methyltransferase [Lachnospiraceae bacterium]|nr:class I SAM-dependent methyltransferase [Lachnospiraceae bacterium]